MAVVLIVDDDLVTRALVRHIVAELGHEALEAGDGEDGLEILESEAVDLVLCDQEMPHMTGLELRAHLGEAFTTPFVLLTGYAEAGELHDSDDEEASGAAASIDGYMTKPMSSAALGGLINELLDIEAASPVNVEV